MLSLANGLPAHRLGLGQEILGVGRSNLLYRLCRAYVSPCKPTDKPKSCQKTLSLPSKSSGGSGCSIKGSGGAGGKHQIKYTPYVRPVYRDHDAKNMGLNRPMSPHLTVYAPTVPAMTSILQRMTGIILTTYAFSMSCGCLFLSNGIDSFVSMIQSLDLSRVSVVILKMILGAPFAFHYCYGIRFVLWNAGRGLTMKEVNSSAKQMAIAAAAITFLFALL